MISLLSVCRLNPQISSRKNPEEGAAPRFPEIGQGSSNCHCIRKGTEKVLWFKREWGVMSKPSALSMQKLKVKFHFSLPFQSTLFLQTCNLSYFSLNGKKEESTFQNIRKKKNWCILNSFILCTNENFPCLKRMPIKTSHKKWRNAKSHNTENGRKQLNLWIVIIGQEEINRTAHWWGSWQGQWGAKTEEEEEEEGDNKEEDEDSIN